MELIRTIREKRKVQRQLEIQQASEQDRRLADFDHDMYNAYIELPLVPIDRNWTVPQILEKLSEVRSNFVKAKLKEVGLPRVAAML